MEWIKIDKNNLPKGRVLGACFDNEYIDGDGCRLYGKKVLGQLEKIDGFVYCTWGEDYWGYLEHTTHYIDIDKFDL